ncbi:MAG: type II toxin-antitoxin system Phd/YefM family antitoxin [Jiangellaceae bacterium]
MTEVISQRELRNDNAEIMRRVEAGERFTVTRHGKAIADIVPHRTGSTGRRRRTLGELQAEFRQLPPIDVDRWYADRAAADAFFGNDDIDDVDAWARRDDDAVPGDNA